VSELSELSDHFSKVLENKSSQHQLTFLENTQTSRTSRTEINTEVYKERFCFIECQNFQKPECPLFFNKLNKTSLLRMKCYGFKAPNPGEQL